MVVDTSMERVPAWAISPRPPLPSARSIRPLSDTADRLRPTSASYPGRTRRTARIGSGRYRRWDWLLAQVADRRRPLGSHDGGQKPTPEPGPGSDRFSNGNHLGSSPSLLPTNRLERRGQCSGRVKATGSHRLSDPRGTRRRQDYNGEMQRKKKVTLIETDRCSDAPRHCLDIKKPIF